MLEIISASNYSKGQIFFLIFENFIIQFSLRLSFYVLGKSCAFCFCFVTCSETLVAITCHSFVALICIFVYAIPRGFIFSRLLCLRYITRHSIFVSVVAWHICAISCLKLAILCFVRALSGADCFILCFSFDNCNSKVKKFDLISMQFQIYK